MDRRRNKGIENGEDKKVERKTDVERSEQKRVRILEKEKERGKEGKGTN